LRLVPYLVADRGEHVSLQIKSFVVNLEGDTTCEFRNRAAEISTVIVVDHVITVDVFVTETPYALRHAFISRILRLDYTGLIRSSIDLSLALEQTRSEEHTSELQSR